MSTKVLELKAILQQDTLAAMVSSTWNTYHMQRQNKVNEWIELRDFIFATDTSTTSVQSLPWKNKTTIPKLCQLRDNLHSNYISALFPNDDWLTWQAYTQDAALKSKAKAIEGYMSNKCRESHFRTEISKLVYDYIDYGNAICTADFVTKYKSDPDGGKIADYVGPQLRRISPLDIVFNPLANNFKETFKVVRSIKSLGELKKLAQEQPEQTFWLKALEHRQKVARLLTGYRYEDFQKACGYMADGFGNMYEYFMGSNMEILEFFGDYVDPVTQEVKSDMVITITDRNFTAREEPIPTWYNGSPFWHVGWRFRQDNLWAMGPLDNLVGMQYRIDHLENLKADAMDLVVHPPIKIIGDVEEFTWGPGAEIHLDEGGDVGVLTADLSRLAMTNNEIQSLEDKMELYAGAPREAMGVRSPGEKTAFEVSTLFNAGARIFQEKASQFEVELLEPALNGMLETARRNMDGSDVIRVMDDDLGVQQFMTITKQDITAVGKLRPVGARHFAQQSQDLQNLVGVFNSPIGQMIQPHTSALALTDFVNDAVGVRGYNIFSPNVAVGEHMQTQVLANQAQEDMQVQQATPSPEGAAAPQGVKK
jgi:hypothetical protein